MIVPYVCSNGDMGRIWKLSRGRDAGDSLGVLSFCADEMNKKLFGLYPKKVV